MGAPSLDARRSLRDHGHTFPALHSHFLYSFVQGMVPVVLLLTAAQPATYVPFRPLPTLPGLLLLVGSFSDQPTVYGWSAILDFSGQDVTVLRIGPTGHLHLLLMVSITPCLRVSAYMDACTLARAFGACPSLA